MKSIFISKTFWMNLVAVVGAFWAPISQYMSEETIVMLLGAANVIMRMFTKEPVKVLPESK